MRKLFLVAAMLVAATTWADVTGKWTGTLQVERNGEQRDMPAYMILKQDGTKVTGSGGPNAGEQHQISSGRVEGDKLLLEIALENGSLKFELTAAENAIEGTVIRDGGERKETGKLSLKREKE
jgi:hypothetical protein